MFTHILTECTTDQFFSDPQNEIHHFHFFFILNPVHQILSMTLEYYTLYKFCYNRNTLKNIKIKIGLLGIFNLFFATISIVVTIIFLIIKIMKMSKFGIKKDHKGIKYHNFDYCGIINVYRGSVFLDDRIIL